MGPCLRRHRNRRLGRKRRCDNGDVVADLKLLTLTGCRRGEVTGMMRGELSEDGAIWTVL
jgi:hypothetical protein